MCACARASGNENRKKGNKKEQDDGTLTGRGRCEESKSQEVRLATRRSSVKEESSTIRRGWPPGSPAELGPSPRPEERDRMRAPKAMRWDRRKRRNRARAREGERERHFHRGRFVFSGSTRRNKKSREQEQNCWGLHQEMLQGNVLKALVLFVRVKLHAARLSVQAALLVKEELSGEGEAGGAKSG